jgi:hypothetical protein
MDHQHFVADHRLATADVSNMDAIWLCGFYCFLGLLNAAPSTATVTQRYGLYIYTTYIFQLYTRTSEIPRNPTKYIILDSQTTDRKCTLGHTENQQER